MKRLNFLSLIAGFTFISASCFGTTVRCEAVDKDQQTHWFELKIEGTDITGKITGLPKPDAKQAKTYSIGPRGGAQLKVIKESVFSKKQAVVFTTKHGNDYYQIFALDLNEEVTATFIIADGKGVKVENFDCEKL